MNIRPTHFLILHSIMLAMILLTGCTEPIEPGSDLEDPAPAAELGDAKIVNIAGNFLVDAALTIPTITEPVQAGYLLVIEQDNGTEISVELRSPAEPDVMGVVGEDASLTEQGVFSVTFTDVPFPKEMLMGFVDMDLLADIQLQGTAHSDDCIEGSAIEITIKDFPPTGGNDFVIEGTYVATREGVMDACSAYITEETTEDDGGAQ